MSRAVQKRADSLRDKIHPEFLDAMQRGDCSGIFLSTTLQVKQVSFCCTIIKKRTRYTLSPRVRKSRLDGEAQARLRRTTWFNIVPMYAYYPHPVFDPVPTTALPRLKSDGARCAKSRCPILFLTIVHTFLRLYILYVVSYAHSDFRYSCCRYVDA